ncbi:MAG: cation-transporting P-type ATPase [Bilophila wadsworthia]
MQPTKRRPKRQPRPGHHAGAVRRNELARKKADSILKRLFKALINPFTVVLIVLAVISSSPTTSSSSRRIAISPPFSSSASWFSSAARCGLCRSALGQRGGTFAGDGQDHHCGLA